MITIFNLSKKIEIGNLIEGEILLPPNRPNNWWALTVVLPCLPDNFSFQNAYCLNLPERSAREFILSQNDLNDLSKNSIFISAVLTESCRFSLDQVDVFWNESFPAKEFPQISSIPSLSGKDLLNFVERRNKAVIDTEIVIWKNKRTKRDDIYEKDSQLNKKNILRIQSVYFNKNSLFFYLNPLLNYWNYNENYDTSSEDAVLGLEIPCRAKIAISEKLSNGYRSSVTLPMKKFGNRFLVSISSRTRRDIQTQEKTVLRLRISKQADDDCIIHSNNIILELDPPNEFLYPATSCYEGHNCHSGGSCQLKNCHQNFICHVTRNKTSTISMVSLVFINYGFWNHKKLVT